MRVCLVSRDYLADDFSKSLSEIISVADANKCSVITMSLFSIDNVNQHLQLSLYLRKTKHVQKLVFESGDLNRETDLLTEVWCKGLEHPFIFKRQFATSSEPEERKLSLMNQLHYRLVDGALILICGEANITKWDRKRRSIADAFGFLSRVQTLRPKIIINPWHTRCRRYEANLKRSKMSEGRTVVSVWNQCSHIRGDGKTPWVAFRNGQNITTSITELRSPIHSRSDIRIGVLDA